MRIGGGPDLLTPIQTNATFERAQIERRIVRPTERLATGLRVNRASDDAASLAIASRLGFEAESLQQGVLNAGRSVSALQIADGAMSEINGLLVRMKVLTLQASSENISDRERALLDTEYQALKDEICRLAVDTTVGGKHILGSSCDANIPFDRFGLIARVNPPGSPGPAGALADNGALGNGNLVADAGEFLEFVYEYRSTEFVDQISYSNARLNNVSLGAEAGDTVQGVVVAGAAADGDGFVFNDGAPLPDANTGVLNQVTSGDDLDLIFQDGTDGAEFEIIFDFTFRDSSGSTRAVQLTFGTGTVGQLAEGDELPLRSVVEIVAPGDRDVSARIGSGILPDEDDISAVIPDVTIDNLNFSLPSTTILTVDEAERSFGIVDDAIDTLATARATVGAQLSTIEKAIDSVRRIVELKTAGQANLLAANIAQETTNLANGQIQLAVTTDVVADFATFQRAFSFQLVNVLDAFGR